MLGLGEQNYLIIIIQPAQCLGVNLPLSKLYSRNQVREQLGLR